eukprot:NODE_7778_length_421_cov_297.521858.p2 GENE.NODE_7778_length_421_cov_297.521858~~NODE_7778_length_421_cov_297.521858.p2  ORF type:complete len:80 (+),score=19.67 NODE_7778_length_421_cov_297.521858:59-298(+)
MLVILAKRALDPGSRDDDMPPACFGRCIVCGSIADHHCTETDDPICGRACKYLNLLGWPAVVLAKEKCSNETAEERNYS